MGWDCRRAPAPAVNALSHQPADRPMLRTRFPFASLAALLVPFSLASAQDAVYKPRISAASDEPLRAMKRFRVPPGLQVDLFAAEPMLANPVAFCFDGKGRCYVAETFRLHAGVPDIRGHMNWLDDDLACRTVED